MLNQHYTGFIMHGSSRFFWENRKKGLAFSFYSGLTFGEDNTQKIDLTQFTHYFISLTFSLDCRKGNKYTNIQIMLHYSIKKRQRFL